MKKFLLYFFSILIILSICGCSNKKEKLEVKKELNCDNLNNIKYYLDDCYSNNNSFKYKCFITNDNDIYMLDEDQLFSNDTNCKKINNDNIKIKKYGISKYSLKFFVDYENNIYYINNKNSLEKLSNLETNIGNYELEKLENDNVIYISPNYLLKNDGKLYKYNEEKNEYELFKEFPNEKILEINESLYIKTNKSFYIYDIINKEECEYDFNKDDFLTENYDNISIFLEYYSKDLEEANNTIVIGKSPDYNTKYTFIDKEGKYISYILNN